MIDKTFTITQENVSGQFISIRETISKFFTTIPGFFETVFNYMKMLMDDNSRRISHFIHGELYEPYKAEFPKKMILHILIFYDEFETNNPLASHAGVYKIGGTYFSLLCVPPEHYSKLENFFLTLLFNSEYRKVTSFGNQKCFQPIIDELLEMESTPIRGLPLIT